MKRKKKCLKKWLVVLICLFFTISEISMTDNRIEVPLHVTESGSPSPSQWTQQQLTDSQDVCTGEQIGTYDGITILHLGLHMARQVRVSWVVLCYFCAALWLLRGCVGWRWNRIVVVSLHRSRERMIRYIHKKDGAKGCLS